MIYFIILPLFSRCIFFYYVHAERIQWDWFWNLHHACVISCVKIHVSSPQRQDFKKDFFNPLGSWLIEDIVLADSIWTRTDSCWTFYFLQKTTFLERSVRIWNSTLVKCWNKLFFSVMSESGNQFLVINKRCPELLLIHSTL